MRISSRDVQRAFEDALRGVRTREQIASWAAAMMRLEDANRLEYEPKQAEERIWNALEFLKSCDSKDAPGSYLHSLEDVRKFWSGTEGDDKTP